jgi:hypothetical protein
MIDKELIQDLIKRGVTLEAMLNEILPGMKNSDIEEMRRWLNSYIIEYIIRRDSGIKPLGKEEK